ncbi:MAG: phosphotransferase [Firmicutes bacterium]|nr:phosphotransferase [[Eubacterium] siraeum]MCM1488385.1 phosphotransferase [Bacillota bacterium]
MKYQELRKNGSTVAQTAKIEVVEQDGVAYKIFDKSFSRAQIFYEAMLQTKAEEAGVRVPKIYGIEPVDDRLAIASEYIEGKTVTQLLEEYPAKTDFYIDIMVQTQLSIHQHVVSDIKKLKHKIAREIKANAVLDEIKKYELETRLASMPQHNKLCHGNFGPENVVIDEMDKIIVLDWVAAARGNAGADVAKTYLKLTLISTEMAEKYITVFCEKSGEDRQYVYEWLPLIAACGLNEKNLSEKEKAVLYSWLDIVDHD